jgi:ATP-dependent exoDNAse (exonuclease V) beta subunit
VRHRHAPPDAETDRACAEALWAEHDVRGSRPEQGLAALAALRASELWERLLAADAVHAEVPVGGPLDGHGAVRGTVDLAYCRGGAWHLVDYKTDGDAIGEALAGCAARHAEQLAVYAALWEAATGAAPASRSLWFTASNALRHT